MAAITIPAPTKQAVVARIGPPPTWRAGNAQQQPMFRDSRREAAWNLRNQIC
jgi:hypothetical protein